MRTLALALAAAAAATAGRWWPAVRDWASSVQGGPGAADAIARAIVVELGSKGTRQERAGIAYVAINRAKRWGAKVPDVIYSRVEGRPVWGSRPSKYNPLLDRVDTGSRWYKRALDVAQAALAGTEPNPIGRRRAFVHPTFPSYRSPGGTRVATDVPGLGRRWLPSWSVSKKEPGGRATYEPVNVGTTPTRFS